jgi:hypothetical protein
MRSRLGLTASICRASYFLCDDARRDVLTAGGAIILSELLVDGSKGGRAEPSEAPNSVP